MAINPNTDFVAGAVLTAAQQNRFPRGVIAYVARPTNANYTSETVDLTTASFTAVANRYYKITFYHPQLQVNAANGYSILSIRKGTTTAGDLIQSGFVSNPTTGLPQGGMVVAITTLTAGSQTVCGTITSTNTTSTNNSVTRYGFLMVEDIGPA